MIGVELYSCSSVVRPRSSSKTRLPCLAGVSRLRGFGTGVIRSDFHGREIERPALRVERVMISRALTPRIEYRPLEERKDQAPSSRRPPTTFQAAHCGVFL
jgi:hypothetical protein